MLENHNKEADQAFQAVRVPRQVDLADWNIVHDKNN